MSVVIRFQVTMMQPTPVQERSLAVIIRLLNLFPGVHAADAMVCDDESVHIRFRCNSFDSLGLIQSCATTSNAGRFFVVEADFRSMYDTEGTDMWFFMDIESDWNEDGTPRRSEIFGVFLARVLKTSGLLSPEESHQIQEAWNAEPL